MEVITITIKFCFDKTKLYLPKSSRKKLIKSVFSIKVHCHGPGTRIESSVMWRKIYNLDLMLE